MKLKILVPTDFSAYARNALDYALALSKELEAEIVLLHCLVYNDSSFIYSEEREEENTRRYNLAKDCLDQEWLYCKSVNPDVAGRAILDSGPIDLTISSTIELEDIDFVVMGTAGASGLRAVVLGSFTSHVIHASSRPVLAVPVNSVYVKIKKVVCTSALDETEMEAIEYLLPLVIKLQAQLIFYHVQEHKRQENRLQNFQDRINEMTDYKNIDYVIVESRDILNSMEEYVCQQQPDLIVTLGKKRTFFNELFGKKVSKKLCLHTSIPLLAFPSSDKLVKGSSDRMKIYNMKNK